LQKKWQVAQAVGGGNQVILSRISEQENVKAILITDLYISFNGANTLVNFLDLNEGSATVLSLLNNSFFTFWSNWNYVINGTNINLSINGATGCKITVGYIPISENPEEVSE
jgi:hypothetical protein